MESVNFLLLLAVCCVTSLAIGVGGTLAVIHHKRKKNVRVIKRLYPTLSLARDVYNQVSYKLDKENYNFKLLELRIKQEKSVGAYAVICTYEVLGDEIFTF